MITVELPKMQPKKHSIRFDAVKPDAAVSSIYISRKALEGLDISKGVRVTINLLNDKEG